jgi:competence protein ComEC
VHLPAPGWIAVTSYVGGLALLLLWWRSRRHSALLAGTSLLAVAIASAAWPLVRPADGRLRVTILDVGQGDAIVIEMPDGRVVLVDTGSGGPMRLDAGERVIAPFLWNKGILSLGAVALTHDDSDHAGGAASLRRLFWIGEEWTAANLPEVPRHFGRVEMTPLPPASATTVRRNEGALVLRIQLGLAAFLLTSDIGAGRERELLASDAPLRSTVLKVAHHGSRSSTSAEFLRAVEPRLAALSVGARNPYGHPDAGVMTRLTDAGARTYRTDRDGALIFETDGRILTLTRWATGAVERLCLEPETIC